jgi:hypothetical protein
MPTSAHLKEVLKALNLKGYSKKTHHELCQMVENHAKTMGMGKITIRTDEDLAKVLLKHQELQED